MIPSFSALFCRQTFRSARLVRGSNWHEEAGHETEQVPREEFNVGIGGPHSLLKADHAKPM